jgi:hypothetical protein
MAAAGPGDARPRPGQADPGGARVGAGINSASPERAVQLPIELAPAMQRLLMDWCRDTAHRLQVRGIARGDVIEALLEHLVSDERAASAVRERLARQLATS